MGVEAKDAFDKPVQSNANGTETVRAAKPVPELRVGDSAFKKGYSDGFMNLDYNNTYGGGNNYTNYDNGYELGMADREEGNPERWRYQASTPTGWTRNADGKVTPPPGTVFKAQSGPDTSWPFPSGNK
jgi:hypothetical protein